MNGSASSARSNTPEISYPISLSCLRISSAITNSSSMITTFIFSTQVLKLKQQNGQMHKVLGQSFRGYLGIRWKPETLSRSLHSTHPSISKSPIDRQISDRTIALIHCDVRQCHNHCRLFQSGCCLWMI